MAIQIITTVGTSVITNYKSQFDTTFFKTKRLPSINTEYDFLEKNQSNAINEKAIFDRLTQKWIKGICKIKDGNGKVDWKANLDQLNKSCCAEIQTIEAIALKPEFEGQELHIHLLTTETVLSNLAARIIEKAYEGHSLIKVMPIVEVKGLQVESYDTFKKTGFTKLVQEVRNVLELNEILDRAYYLLANKKQDDFKKEFKNCTFEDNLQELVNSILKIEEDKKASLIPSWKDYLDTQTLFTQRDKVILNISGGYKAVIPVLTLVGQLYNVPLFYTYEDSADLIEVKKLPIDFDWVLANRCLPLLVKEKLQDTNYQNNANFKPIFNLMKESGLIEDDFSITMFGELFADYAIKYSPNQNEFLGVFYEYVLFEYYHTFFKDVEIERSFFMCDKKGDGAYEVDLCIENTNQEVVIIEAKGLGAILDDKRRESVKEQIRKKLRIWFNIKKDKNGNPLPELGKDNKAEHEKRKLVNYRLSIWTFEEFNDELENHKADLAIFKAEIENETEGEFKDYKIALSVDFMPIKMSYADMEEGQSKAPINNFLKKIENIKDLKPLIGKPISDFITIKS